MQREFSLARVPGNYGRLTGQHTVGLPNDISLFASRRRSTLPPAGERLFSTADCHICSPGITRIVLSKGRSVSNLWPSHQQPRGLCTLFVSAILFLCAQDCDRGAQSFMLVCLTELGSSGENRDILCNFIPFNYYLLICFLFLAFSSNYLLLVLSLFTWFDFRFFNLHFLFAFHWTPEASIFMLVRFMPRVRHKSKYKISKNPENQI